MANRAPQLLALCVAVAALVGSSLLSPAIQRQRQELRLDPAVDLGGAPPHIAVLTTALGSFRGLLADMLWYRTEELKQEGKFFEADSLAQLITSLQPRFPQVWVFQGWNMAYNISVKTHTKEERWDWVNKGIRLVRERGLPYNPRAVPLYKELSNWFIHKIGGTTDDMHKYYKARLAEEWQFVLGGHTARLDALAERRVPGAEAEAFKPVRDAAVTYFGLEDTDDPEAGVASLAGVGRAGAADARAALLADHPEAAPLMAELEALGLDFDREGLLRVGRVMAWLRYQDPDPDTSYWEPTDRALFELLDPTAWQGEQAGRGDAWAALLAWWRAKVLIRDYHMDPRTMHEMLEMFGPMDWRHAASHAAYWAWLGAEVGAEQLRRDPKDIDLLNTDRQVIHAMQELFRGGQVTYRPGVSLYDREVQIALYSEQPRFIEGYRRAAREASERQGNPPGQIDRRLDTGYQNFLQQAIIVLHLNGERERAAELLAELRRDFTDDPEGDYHQDLAAYVADRLSAEGASADDTALLVSIMLQRAFVYGLGQGRNDLFAQNLSMALDRHQRFNADTHKAHANALGGQGRLELAPFDEMLINVLANVMVDQTLNLQTRSQIYRLMRDQVQFGDRGALPYAAAAWVRARVALGTEIQARLMGQMDRTEGTPEQVAQRLAARRDAIMRDLFPPPPAPEAPAE